jgi:LSD1 subclass zinc finger protein
MSLPKKLISKLACPGCRSPLAYHPTEKRLECATCAATYRVDDGIPMLQVEEPQKVKQVGR